MASGGKGVRKVNFSLEPTVHTPAPPAEPPDRPVTASDATGRAIALTIVAQTPRTVQSARPPAAARKGLLTPRMEGLGRKTTSFLKTARAERQSALDGLVSTLPHKAASDPIGYAVQAHARRWARRSAWRWNYVDPGPVDSPALFRSMFRLGIRPLDLRQGVSARHQRLRAAGLVDDEDEEDGTPRRRRPREEPPAVRIPRIHLLLPSRFRAPCVCCPHCQRPHVGSLVDGHA